MGTGFSVVCSSKRSVVISNSICAIRTEHDGVERPVQEEPSKLHPCISRDSGIAESEIHHTLSLSRALLDDVDARDIVNEESDDNNNDPDVDEPYKPSRPHSCRLGNRNAKKNNRNDNLVVEEDRLVKYVRKTASSGGDSGSPLIDSIEGMEKEDSFYKNFRPKSAKTRSNAKTRDIRAKTAEVRKSSVPDDLIFSSDTDSDSEFWTIPDETYCSSRDKGHGKKGWVMDDDDASSGTLTPNSKSPDVLDYYRIVQESYNRYDANLAKKASERSISSIILLPSDGMNSPTHSDLSNTTSECTVLPAQLQQRMDNLISSFTDALYEQGSMTVDDYVTIMRKLRHPLVEFVACCIACNITPRVHMTTNHALMLSDNSTIFQLKPSDEEILEASEKQLAQRLADRGNAITSEDVASVFGDHMRTIEQLQHVRDILTDSETTSSDCSSPRKSPHIIKKKTASSSSLGATCVTDVSNDVIDDDNGLKMDNADVNGIGSRPTVIRKSSSLDERRLRDSMGKITEMSHDEYILLLEMLQNVWSQRETFLVMELEMTLRSLRNSFGGKTKESVSTDKKFCQNLIEKLNRDVLKKDEFAKAIIDHMSKTGSVKVRSIQVTPAPISRTRSLNDAVADTRLSESSAGSSTSRRSEPDMRRWKLENEFGIKNVNLENRGRVMTAKKRATNVQTHGLAPMAPLREGAEDQITLTKVEELEGKYSVKSRPDSGIAVSMSSGSYSSYSSTDVAKETETDEMDEACITESSEMLDRVEKVKIDQHNDIKSLAAAITKGLTTQSLKAKAVYCWLANVNLTKMSRMKHKPNTPLGKLKQLAEKKTSYASLYQELCRAAGLKCEKIEGYVKSKDYLPGNTVQSQKFQHTWCAVQLDGHYRLVDPMYGARREKFFMDHFFMTAPDNLILSHYPKDKRWLLMNQTINVEAFEDTVKAWPAMFHFNIRPLSMKSVIRTYDGKLSITVLLRNVAVIPHLEYAGPGTLADEDALADNIDEEIRDVENAETFHITLPQEGNYYFTLYAHVMEDELDVPVFQHRVEYVDELL